MILGELDNSFVACNNLLNLMDCVLSVILNLVMDSYGKTAFDRHKNILTEKRAGSYHVVHCIAKTVFMGCTLKMFYSCTDMEATSITSHNILLAESLYCIEIRSAYSHNTRNHNGVLNNIKSLWLYEV